MRPVARVLGSIPAHAGEPYLDTKRDRNAPVYPRPRGGTSALSMMASMRLGLSPPTRGNRWGW